MAFGLIQQVLRGGEVVAIEVEVIRQNDHYIVRRGTNSGIEHEINLNDARGEIVGAYSVATLKRSEEHTSELQSLMRISYAVFCLKKKKTKDTHLIQPIHEREKRCTEGVSKNH